MVKKKINPLLIIIIIIVGVILLNQTEIFGRAAGEYTSCSSVKAVACPGKIICQKKVSGNFIEKYTYTSTSCPTTYSVSPSCECEGGNGGTTCTETDDGKDYYEAGTTSAGGITKTDYCSDSQTLIEYYCSNNEIRVITTTCSEGACSNAICTSGGGGGTNKLSVDEVSFYGAPSAIWDESKQRIIVTQKYTFSDSGLIMLEAGIPSLSRTSTYEITSNACDPEDGFYANRMVYMTKGTHTIKFELIPHKEGTSKSLIVPGTYTITTAVVPVCKDLSACGCSGYKVSPSTAEVIVISGGGNGGQKPKVTFRDIEATYTTSSKKIFVSAYMTFQESGTYILEAGSEKISLGDRLMQTFFPSTNRFIITTNYCNPDDKNFANEEATVEAKEYETNFYLVPKDGDGTYATWVAVCDKCGTPSDPPLCTLSGVEEVKVTSDCDCGDWVKGGVETCQSGKIRYTRTCTPFACADEEKRELDIDSCGECESDSDCFAEYGDDKPICSDDVCVARGTCEYLVGCPSGTKFCGSNGECFNELPSKNCKGEEVKGIGGSCLSDDKTSWLFSGDESKITSDCITGMCRDLKSSIQGEGVCDELVCCEISDLYGLLVTKRYMPKRTCEKKDVPASLNPHSATIVSLDKCKVDSKFDKSAWEEARRCAEEELEIDKCEDYQYLYKGGCYDRKDSIAENKVSTLSFEYSDLTDFDNLLDPENPVCFSNKMCDNKRCRKANNDESSGLGYEIYGLFIDAVDEEELESFVNSNEKTLKSELGMESNRDVYENYGLCTGAKIPFNVCEFLEPIDIGLGEAVGVSKCVGGGIVLVIGIFVLVFLYSMLSKPPRRRR